MNDWSHLETVKAWAQLTDLMNQMKDVVLEDARNELEVADGLSVVLRALAVATEVGLDANPETPRFVRLDTPMRNIGGDNPAAEYDVAMIDGRHDYHLWGTINTISYLGFDVMGGRGMNPRRKIRNVADKQITMDDKGNFNIILSVEKPKNLAVNDTWIEIEEDASALILRQYIADRAVNKPADLHIEMIDPPQPLTMPTDASIAERIIAAAWTMVKLSSLHRTVVPSLMNRPNELLRLGAEELGAENISLDNMYMMGTYAVAKDQALVIDVIPPETRYWVFCVENIWHECIDYMSRPVSVTNAQAKMRADGSLRVVLAHTNPLGADSDANWIDLSGRERGFMLFRWMDNPTVDDAVVKLLPLDEASSVQS